MKANGDHISLRGEEGAFGWASARAGQTALTCGGLAAGRAYRVLTDAGQSAFTASAAGAWRGAVAGAPLCVLLLPSGALTLYDDARLTRDAARALALRSLQDEKKADAAERPAAIIAEAPAREAARETVAEAILPAQEAVAAETSAAEIPLQIPAEQAPAEEIPAEEAPPPPPVPLRAQTGEAPVDALPTLVWPREAEALKAYFDTYSPVALFDAPLWRFVRVPGQGNGVCCVGYRAENDRVTQTLHAVRARGGLMPPKGLQGYRYQRGMDGAGYWTLWRRV